MTRELVFKRQMELEKIYRGVHMDVDSDSARKILNNLIDSGLLPSLSLYYRSQINNLRVLIYSFGFCD